MADFLKDVFTLEKYTEKIVIKILKNVTIDVI